MTRTIFLHGSLKKKFGAKFNFSVETAGEAFRALYTALGTPFLEAMKEGSYQIIRGRRQGGMHVDLEIINSFKLGAADLHIVPAARGALSSKAGGTIKAVLGIAIIGAAIFMSGGLAAGAGGLLAGMGGSAFAIPGLGAAITWGNIATLGVGLALAGASTLLAGNQDGHNESDHKSFMLNGPVNTSEQGNAIALIYGEGIVGSQAISSGFDIQDIAIGFQPYGSLQAQFNELAGGHG